MMKDSMTETIMMIITDKKTIIETGEKLPVFIIYIKLF
ncbi:hypothetical protein CLU97_1564 [Chryseobacterium sp. 7]|nr:hypothetical protein CLU97_1564 [Chryseobacterium sp. 7]